MSDQQKQPEQTEQSIDAKNHTDDQPNKADQPKKTDRPDEQTERVDADDDDDDDEFLDGACAGCGELVTAQDQRDGDEMPCHENAWPECPMCGTGPWCNGYCMADKCCFAASGSDDDDDD
jgi:hypothetical protein